MRTLLVKPTIPTPSPTSDPVLEAPLGRRAFSYRPLGKRPLQSFQLRFAVHSQEQAERLRELVEYSGAYTPIWFDGNAWTEIKHPRMVWIGDGATTEFILPFRNVFPSSSLFAEDGIPKTDWTMPDNGVSGVTVFTAAPGAGAEITWQGLRKIKVRVRPSGGQLFDSTERSPSQYLESLELEELA